MVPASKSGRAFEAASRVLPQLSAEAQALFLPAILYPFSVLCGLWAGSLSDAASVVADPAVGAVFTAAGPQINEWIAAAYSADSDEALDRAGASFVAAVGAAGLDAIRGLVGSPAFARFVNQLQVQSTPAPPPGRPSPLPTRPGPWVPPMPAGAILDLCAARVAQLEQGQGVIDRVGALVVDPFDQVKQRIQRLRDRLAVQGDTRDLRVEAAGLLQELGQTLPGTPASRLEAPSSTIAGRYQGVSADLGYFAQHPGEGLKVTTGLQDVSGLPGPNMPSTGTLWAIGGVVAGAIVLAGGAVALVHVAERKRGR